MTKTKIAKEIATWLITLLLAADYAYVGIGKFLDHNVWTRVFHLAHYPDWFRILIGVVETAAALLLLAPRTAVYGAAMIVVVMIGAVGTLLIMPIPHWNPASPLVPMLLAAIVLLARWHQRAR
jgi:uncharacterized membrane protein YphA (DoxX/SURF4 family)